MSFLGSRNANLAIDDFFHVCYFHSSSVLLVLQYFFF